MLYWLLYPLKDDFPFLRIFAYVSFRVLFAALTALAIMAIFGPRIIAFLHSLKFKESVRALGPQSHQTKAGTPTMGGLMIILSLSISILLWGNLSNHYVLAVWFGTLLMTAVGFWDDYQKSVLKRPGGMKARAKLLYQTLIALAFALFIFYNPYVQNNQIQTISDLFVPFLKEPVLQLGLWIVPFWMIVVVGSSNAVNITDGLDGLAIGLSIIVLGTLAVFAYLTGLLKVANYLLLPFIPEANELAVFLAALGGAAVGFLWYNGHPAQVFMGDTGSLSIGSAIGMVAVCIKKEILLVILGGVFVIELLSVVLQVGSFKLRGKRIFKMAPLHHHFELLGWPETKVVVRFWILGFVLALLALSSLKIT